MRIGLIAPPWLPVPPRGYGGVEAVVDALARVLQDAGHDVVLAASGDSTCPVERVPGFPPSDPGTIGTAEPERHHVARAYTLLTKVDIIHDHTDTGPWHAPHPPGIPIVATLHGPLHPTPDQVHRAARGDVCLVAISHDQASRAPDLRVSRVIHHGINPATVPVGPGTGGYVCFLGRMHPHKGVREAIHVARSSGMPLRIAAKMRSAAEWEYFNAAVRPLLGSDTEYLGELTTADKYALLGGAIALLNPVQWDEPFGMVMIEALAAGTPVVGTRRGSAPEIIDDGQTGFLRAHAAQLSDALSRASELDRRRCRHAAEQRFTAARMAAEHVDLYGSLLAHAQTRSPR